MLLLPHVAAALRHPCDIPSSDLRWLVVATPSTTAALQLPCELSWASIGSGYTITAGAPPSPTPTIATGLREATAGAPTNPEPPLRAARGS